MTTKKKTVARRTIKFSELKRLSFAANRRLPRVVKIRDDRRFVYREWVGIGWIEIDPPDNTDRVVEVIDG